MWHERVSGKSDGSNNKNHVQDVYPATRVHALSPSHCCRCSAIRNFTHTQNVKVSRILKNKEDKARELPAFSEMRHATNFFSHENIGSGDFIAFCAEIHSFQKS